jgi:large subunit ribosomal protein L25
MADAEVLDVEVRSLTGKLNNRRLRRAGSIPAVLYGHGQECVNLSVGSVQLAAALRHGSRLVALKGGVDESALIRELQWDAFGQHILHIDFTRTSADERLEVTVDVELRGVAPGIRSGGVVEQLAREIELECRAGDIPEKIEVNVNHLELDGSIDASELTLPAGAKLITPADTMIVHCVLPTEQPEEDEGIAGAVEPEVIGRKAEDGEEEGDS